MPAQTKTSSASWEVPLTKPLDQAVWQKWVEKGRAQDRRSSAVRLQAIKWGAIGVLLAAAGLGAFLVPYDVVIRFLVAGGALVVMLQAIHIRKYALAAVFLVLVLLYNPVTPLIRFSGNWQRAVVLASAIPFVMSLMWHKVGVLRHA